MGDEEWGLIQTRAGATQRVCYSFRFHLIRGLVREELENNRVKEIFKNCTNRSNTETMHLKQVF